MSADLLREAAAKMREDAKAATDTGAWDWRAQDGSGWWAETTRSGRYIQAWHPAVALAVADWLECYAAVADRELPIAFDNQALAVARAHLGTDA